MRADQLPLGKDLSLLDYLYDVAEDKVSAEEAYAAITAWRDAYTATKVREAEQRGVAWSIGIVDEIHLNADGTFKVMLEDEADRLMKGVKNTLRARYEAVTGVDPAPSYPVRVHLHQPDNQGQGDALTKVAANHSFRHTNMFTGNGSPACEDCLLPKSAHPTQQGQAAEGV